MRIAMAALVIFATSFASCGSDAPGAHFVPPARISPLTPDRAGAVPYNEAIRIATHNSYWVNRDSVQEFLASGTQERLLDQILFDQARAIEIDVHRDDANDGDFTVYHTYTQRNSLCSPLSECLQFLRTFHYALPQHEVFTIVIELKELWTANFIDPRHTPDALDHHFRTVLGDKLLFTPAELLDRCPGATTLREATGRCGWPSVGELRGRFLVTVIGNWRLDGVDLGQGPEDWITYATWGGGIRDRVGFPMYSDFTKFYQDSPAGAATPAELETAVEASVFWQVEDLRDARVPAFVSEVKGVVRAKDSFSVADQWDRIGAGYQLVQTDYPWNRALDDGPSMPFHHRRTFRPIVEPGDRLRLRAHANGESFASLQADESRCHTWESYPATTRPSPDARYPNHARVRGRGCLRAAAGDSPTADMVAVCRQVIEQEIAEITVEQRQNGKVYQRSVHALARRAAGPGELVRLVVCRDKATAFSASRINKDGVPEWQLVEQLALAAPHPIQGLSGRDEVVFVGTRKDGQRVSGADLRLAPHNGGPANEGELDDLSFQPSDQPEP
jgi:hypothetical protein